MIEREFVAQKTREYYIHQFVKGKLRRVGVSSVRLKKIPLGEKIVIETSRPSVIVGSKGSTIRDLTKSLKKQFKLENPQIEIIEVKEPNLDATIVAEQIASYLERFGSARFKSIGHKSMENVLRAGALGVEVVISGKIPGARAKNWRFYQGYLKKSGDISIEGVRKAYTFALLKTGVIGIKVSIMPSDIVLPDHIEIKKELVQEEKESKLEPVVIEEKPKFVKKPRKKAQVKKVAKPEGRSEQ